MRRQRIVTLTPALMEDHFLLRLAIGNWPLTHSDGVWCLTAFFLNSVLVRRSFDTSDALLFREITRHQVSVVGDVIGEKRA